MVPDWHTNLSKTETPALGEGGVTCGGGSPVRGVACSGAAASAVGGGVIPPAPPRTPFPLTCVQDGWLETPKFQHGELG